MFILIAVLQVFIIGQIMALKLYKQLLFLTLSVAVKSTVLSTDRMGLLDNTTSLYLSCVCITAAQLQHFTYTALV